MMIIAQNAGVSKQSRKNPNSRKDGENMPREKENFREQYMVISEAFNGKPLLNVSEVARWLRMDRHAVAKRFKFKDGRISAVQLASDMLP